MHWLDITLLVLLVIAIIRGINSGFVKQAISLLSVVGAFLLATPFSIFIMDLLSQQGTNITNDWISWGISFIILVIIFRILGHIFLSGLDIALGSLNKLLGAIFSLLITTILLSVLFGFYSNMGAKYGWPPVPDGLVIYPKIMTVSKTILPEHLFLEIEKSAPLETIKI